MEEGSGKDEVEDAGRPSASSSRCRACELPVVGVHDIRGGDEPSETAKVGVCAPNQPAQPPKRELALEFPSLAPSRSARGEALLARETSALALLRPSAVTQLRRAPA